MTETENKPKTLKDYINEDGHIVNDKGSQPICQLTGINGNVYSILGSAADAIKKAGIPRAIADEFVAECKTVGTYDDIIQHIMKRLDWQ